MESYTQSRIALITGATSGVGKSIAKGLARQKYQVVMLVHDLKKAELVRDEMIAESSNSKIDLIHTDLSSLDSVRAAADVFRKKYVRLHVLSNNAAVLPVHRQFTKDRLEATFGINYLSHFLLTNLLLDVLKRSSPSRIIQVTGGRDVLQRAVINFDDLQNHRYNPIKASIQAALAKTMFSMDLAKRLEGTGVTSNVFHPGLVQSDLGRDLPWYLKWGYDLANKFLREESKTGIYVASAPEIEKVTGTFFSGGKAYPFNPKFVKRQDYERLWGVSAKITGI